MYPNPDYRNAAAGPSITEADGPANPSVASWVQLARDQTHFADQPSLTLEEFKRWPHFPEARQELFCSLHWLTTLLPGDGDESIVRKGITNLVRPLTDLERPKTNDLLALYGPVKQNLRLLCELLAVDPRPHAVAAACGELRLVFGTASGLHVLNELGIAIERAVEAVVRQTPPAARRGDKVAQASTPVTPRPTSFAATAMPSVRPQPVSAAEAPPTSGDAGIAASLALLGIDGVRERCARLDVSLDRLIAFVPAETHGWLQGRLKALRDCYATPSPRFLDPHAEMLEGGYLVLTMLCDKLEELSVIKRRAVLDRLEKEVPQERPYFNQVSRLANVLIAAESIDAPKHNPEFEARRSRFESWAEALLQTSRLTRDEVLDGMELLGLEEVDTVPDGVRPHMHPVYNNAAWQACLGRPLDPVDVPALADIDLVDLALALDGLKKRCEDLVADPTKLDEFSAAWLAKKPTGRDDDKVGPLQAEGVNALRRIDTHLASPGERLAKRTMLVALMGEMATADDPTAVLIRYARQTSA